VCVGERVVFVANRVRDRNAMRHHGMIVGDIVRDRKSSWEIECVSGRESGVQNRVRDRNVMRHHGRIVGDIMRDRERVRGR